MEEATIIAALVFMLMAIGTKVLAGQHIQAMKRHVAQAERDKGQLLTELKSATAHHQVAQRNLAGKEKKKAQLTKRLGTYTKQLAKFEAANKKREEVANQLRRRVVRSD